MNTLNTGSTLKNGAYKIIRTLGQGSFGITYLASARTTIAGALGKMDVEVNIAIKEFFMSDLNSRSADGTSVEKTDSSLVKNYRTKFRREAENLSKLHHSNIVKVLDVFDENNTTYYVMEYVDGMNLDDYIKQQGRLTVSESLRITKEVCSALSYMHEHKMLHLDLKPKNIMRDGEGHIRLIDFGLSKQYNDSGEPESSTTIGLGTPGYAPTEQANYKQDGTLPVTIDVYALGGTLYKMLTGQTPPEASYILNEGLPEDVLSQAGVPEEVIAIVDKAMEPKRKLRYQSVEALSAAISNPQSSESAISNPQDEQTDISSALPKKDEVAAKESENLLTSEPVLDNRSDVKKKEGPNEPNPLPIDSDKEKPASRLYWALGLIGVVLLGFILYSWLPSFDSQQQNNKPHSSSSYMVPSSKYNQSYNTISESNNNSNRDTSTDQYFTVTDNGKTVTFKMIKVEAGSFQMGSTTGEIVARPVHQVTISKDYYMGETEVTQNLWEAIMGQSSTSNGSQWDSYGNGDNYPAYRISYEDCQEFIQRLNQKTGNNFRMPTEAEWEYAARGGNQSKGYTYAGSNTIDDVAWYTNNSGSKIHPVSQKQPNELGLYDMSGNVKEWCYDWYDSKYSSSAQTDPKGPSSGFGRVYRGGSWSYSSEYCRSAYREFGSPTLRRDYIGFRLAL